MRNFELVPDPDSDGPIVMQFVVDGKSYPNSKAYPNLYMKDRLEFTYKAMDDVVIDAILACTLDELFDTDFIQMHHETIWNDLSKKKSIFNETEYGDEQERYVPTGRKTIRMALSESSDVEFPYSLLEFASATERVIRRLDRESDLSLQFDLYDGPAVAIFTTLPIVMDQPLASIFEPFEEECLAIFDQAISELKKGSKRGQILASFEFPEGLQTACEQYLLYFSQFLRDLGIQANSRLTEEAGHVMFTVSPNDGDEALAKIREALDLYLTLPSSPIIKSEDSFAADRLQYQIDALKFQIKQREAELRMANRELEHQDVLLLEAKNIIIRHHSVPSQPSDDSVPQLPGKPEKKKVLGLTKVKKAEDWGVEIDLGELFRRLTRKGDDAVETDAER